MSGGVCGAEPEARGAPPNGSLDVQLDLAEPLNEQPIETLGTDRPNESFRDRVRLRRLNRRANDTNAGAPKYVVKAPREFAIAIPNQPANRFRALDDGPGHLPRLLRDPIPVGMRRAAGEVHPPTADFDEEQHVQSLKPQIS
jgi:hypothetical protein